MIGLDRVLCDGMRLFCGRVCVYLVHCFERLKTHPVAKADLSLNGVVDRPERPQQVRCQREVAYLVQNLVDHCLLLFRSDVVLALVVVLHVLVDKVPQLTFVRVVGWVKLVARELLARIVVHPLAEVIGQVEAAIVVGTVEKGKVCLIAAHCDTANRSSGRSGKRSYQYSKSIKTILSSSCLR